LCQQDGELVPVLPSLAAEWEDDRMTTSSEASEELLDAKLGSFMERVASPDDSLGGGSAAAVVVGIAAALVGMAARASSGWSEAAGAIVQADELRSRSAPLAQADAEVYAEARDTLRRRSALEPESRDETIRLVLARAADVPFLIVTTACDVTALAAHVAENGAGEVRGDAAVAAVLAESAARAAANLVQINLATMPDDERLVRARRLVSESGAHARRAIGESS
jgi:methenyltetrahydrofolate cyclohydrolase